MSWILDRLGWSREKPHELEFESDDELRTWFDDAELNDLEWEEAEVHEGHAVTAIFKGSNLATYNLQIFTPDQVVAPGEDFPERDPVHRETEADKRLLADLPAMLEMVEEALENLMPDGYSVRITEWNK